MPWDCEFHALELEFHALELSANCSGRSVRPLSSARGRSKAAQPGDISRERFSDIIGTTGAWGDKGTRRHETAAHAVVTAGCAVVIPYPRFFY